MDSNELKTLIDEALDDLMDALETCLIPERIPLITREHGWEWSDDGRQLSPTRAPGSLNVELGMTLDDVKDVVAKRQERVSSRNEQIVSALKSATETDDAMPLEFAYKRPTAQRSAPQRVESTNTEDPRMPGCLAYVQWKREKLQEWEADLTAGNTLENFKSARALREKLEEWDALFEADLDAWLDKIDERRNNSIEQWLWRNDREQRVGRGPGGPEGPSPTR